MWLWLGLISWLALFWMFPGRPNDSPECGGGGGDQPSPPPLPPPPAETTQRQLETESDPELRARLRREAELDLLSRASAEAQAFIEQGIPAGEAALLAARRLSPETREAEIATANEVIRGLTGQPFGEEVASDIERRFRAQEAQAGRLGSEVGSLNVGRETAAELAVLTENARQARLAAGLSFLGRATLPQVPFGFGGQPLVAGGSTVPSALTSQASIFGTRGDIFGSQLGLIGASRQARADIIGAGLGALGQIGGAFARGCWVAAELFGGWTHPKTNRVRFYMTFRASDALRDWYLAHGERLAMLLREVPSLKRWLRPYFEALAVAGGADA